MNDDQASTAYLSAGDHLEVPSAHAGRLLDDSGEERANVSTTRRRPTQCHACWNPQLGNLRPLHHLYCGDCKLTHPSIAAAAASATAAAAAEAVAAFITANAAPTTAAAANASAASAASNAAAAVYHARIEAALATRLPDSTGSLYESMRSGLDEGQWANVQDEIRN